MRFTRRIKLHQWSVKHGSPELAQENLKADCWKLSGGLSICDIPYSYTLLLAALEKTHWTRQAFGLMPYNLYMPMIYLDTEEPGPYWSWEMLWQSRPGLQPTSLPPSYKCWHNWNKKLPSIFLLLTPFFYLLFVPSCPFSKLYTTEKISKNNSLA